MLVGEIVVVNGNGGCTQADLDAAYQQGYQAGLAAGGGTGGCLTIDNDLGFSVPCAQVGSVQYGFDLDFYNNPNDPFGVYWKLDSSSLTTK